MADQFDAITTLRPWQRQQLRDVQRYLGGAALTPVGEPETGADGRLIHRFRTPEGVMVESSFIPHGPGSRGDSAVTNIVETDPTNPDRTIVRHGVTYNLHEGRFTQYTRHFDNQRIYIGDRGSNHPPDAQLSAGQMAEVERFRSFVRERSGPTHTPDL